MKGGEEGYSFLLPCLFFSLFFLFLFFFSFSDKCFILLLTTRAYSCRRIEGTRYTKHFPDIGRVVGGDGFFFYECNMSGYTAFPPHYVFPFHMGILVFLNHPALFYG
ncbi:hypothetical protein CI102_10766 [Trichoderma harzianum]|nr:hypothetical protein CI102_10766 [Trichoderma harzianum]